MAMSKVETEMVKECSMLERAIRSKATMAALKEFDRLTKEALSLGYPVNNTPAYTHKDHDTLRALLNLYFTTQVQPRVEEKAVQDFFNMYQSLIQQFPNLQGGNTPTQDEGTDNDG